jgi:outer membrane receptor for ferrienterochelin and colicins
MRMRNAGLAGAASLVASTISGPARADDTGDLQGLLSETFVSGASKATESNATAPAIATTLTSDDIRRYGIHSIAEAIDFLSLGAATSNNLGSQDIGSNGVLVPNDQGDHFLLLLNGHAMNEALFGAARFDRGAGIPMEIVDHIEVILGPGSVLYGSSAMLGVINVVTKDARAFAGTHVAAESELLTSWRVAAGGGYEFPLFGHPAKLALELDYYQQDGPALTAGPVSYGVNGYTNKPYAFGANDQPGVWGGPLEHSNYSRIPSGVLTFRVGEVEVDLHASLFKRGMPFNSDFTTPEADFDDPNNEATDRSASLDVKHRLSISAVTELRSRLYADVFDYRRQADSSALGPFTCGFNVPTCRRQVFGASRWVGLEEQLSFDWLKDASVVTLLGIDGRIRSISAQNDVFDAANGQPLQSSDGLLRASDKVFAAYGQQTWNPSTWLGLNGGGRFDYDQRFGGHVSPRLAASVRTWDGGTLKAIYSEAFRAPSWVESSVVGENQVPAGKLEPETVRSVEVAVDQRLGAHRLLFGVFRSWWSNMVELENLTPAELALAQQSHVVSVVALAASQYRNVASIDDLGFNAGYEGSFAQERLRYALNVTGAYSRSIDASGAQLPLPVAPQLFGNARVSYTLPGNLPTIAIAGHYLGPRPVNQAFGAGFVPTPYAPALAELRGTMSGAFPWIHGLSYRADANYVLTDRGPYVIGPFQTGESVALSNDKHTYPTAPLLDPIDRFRATVGLQYDF